MSDEQTIKFGEICREVKVTTKDSIADGYELYIGLEHLDSSSLKIKRWGIIAEDNPSFTRVFKKGQILFGRRRAYLKKAGVAEFDGICSGDIIVMEAISGSGYENLLPYVIHSEPFWAWAIKNSAGGLSPRTKFKSLAEFRFLRLEEPRIRVLDNIFEKLSGSFVFAETVELSLQRLTDLLINNIIRFGIYNETLKETKVGNIPESWGIQEFKKVFAVDTKNGLYKHKSCYGNGPKMVHMGEMFKTRTISEIDIENAVDVSEKELEAYGLENGDLLFARRSLTKEGAGLCCIYKGSKDGATFESSIIRARLDNIKAIPDYFNYFFRSKYGRWLMERIIQTVAASGITGTDLKKMYVPVPPIAEQELIVDLLNTLINANEDSIQTDLERENLFMSLIGELVSV